MTFFEIRNYQGDFSNHSNSCFPQTFFKYNARQQIKDTMPLILLAFVAGFFVRCLDDEFHNYPDIFRLIRTDLVGLLIYFGSSLLFKIESFGEFKKMILR